MKRIFKILPALLSVLSGLLITKCTKNPDTTEQLTVTFLKVGKADGIVLQTAAHTVIIDCGEKSDGKKMVDFLEENGVKTIDYMILTHHDQDHIGGAAKVLKNFTVQNVIAADYTEDSSEYRKLTDAMQAQNLTFQMPDESMTFTLDDAVFTIYPHEGADYADGFDNNCSLVTKIVHHDNTLLFTGDAMQERLSEIMDIGDCDLLKVPYHGRDIANLPAFLDAVTPEYAVISTSKDYLSENVLASLQERNVQTFVTCQDGNITAVSDGREIVFETGANQP